MLLALRFVFLFALMAVAAQARNTQTCTLSPDQQRWIQTAVDGWERSSRDFLKVDPRPFPWTLMVGQSCVWHIEADNALLHGAQRSAAGVSLSGKPLDVRASAHKGQVWLPSGRDLPVAGTAFGSVYKKADSSLAPFFVLALPEVWRQDPKAAAEARLEAIVLGVFSHEVVHTRQLVHVSSRVDDLKRRFRLPDALDDDIVETRFRTTRGYAEAYEAEIALFYRAAVTTNPRERLALTREALALADARRVKYFAGEDAVYADLEGLFLNMEGVAVWVAYQLSKADTRFDIGIKDPAADRARNTWSQDEGLALMLLVDALVPQWRDRMLGPEVASPFVLLRHAVGAH